MSDLEAGLEGLKLVIAAAALFLAVRMLRAAILADWRQDLFAARNELWDRMRAEGCLDAPAHCYLRHRINGLLRFGPEINLATLLATAWLVRRSGRVAPPTAIPSVAGLPTPAAVHAVARAEARLHRAIIRRVLFDTLPGALIGWPAWGVYRMLRTVRGVRDAADRTAHHVRHCIRSLSIEAQQAASEVPQNEPQMAC